MSDCAGAPTTIVETDTATLSHQTYTALPATWVFNLQNGVTTVVYTYPGLIVTDFKPGDTVTDVTHFADYHTNRLCRIIDFHHQQYHRWAPGDKFCSFCFPNCV